MMRRCAWRARAAARRLTYQLCSHPICADSPRSVGSEEDDGGWVGRLRSYILGRGEGEGEEGDEFAPSQVRGCGWHGTCMLRLRWHVDVHAAVVMAVGQWLTSTRIHPQPLTFLLG